MATPEGRVKDRISKVLKSHFPDLYYYMPVPGGYGAPSLDYLCCYRGLFFAIEAKAPSKKPTKRQEFTTELMEAAGGAVFHINSDEGIEELKTWLSRAEL